MTLVLQKVSLMILIFILINFFIVKDNSFFNIFQNYELNRTIESLNNTNSSLFQNIQSFSYLCSSFNGYLVLDHNLNIIIKFDKQFKYDGYINIWRPQFIMALNNSNKSEIFIACFHRIYKLNSELSYLKHYNDLKNRYTCLHYNQTGDYILATSSTNQVIEFFRRDDLTYIKYISTSPYSPNNIRDFNGSLYISTTNKKILVFKNEIIINTFNTLRDSITSLAIDSFGVLAVVYSNYIHLYSINGTYLNFTWTSPLAMSLTSIGFDAFENLIVTSINGIHIFN